MVELKSDIARRSALYDASLKARKDDFNYTMHRTMHEQLSSIRERQMRPKRRIPWVTIISIVSVIPFLFTGEGQTAIKGLKQTSSPEQQLSHQIQNANPDEVATVSVTIGGQTMTRQLTAAEIQAMQN